MEPLGGLPVPGGSCFYLEAERALEAEVAFTVGSDPDPLAAQQGAQDPATALGRAAQAGPKVAHPGLYPGSEIVMVENWGACGSPGEQRLPLAIQLSVTP